MDEGFEEAGVTSHPSLCRSIGSVFQSRLAAIFLLGFLIVLGFLVFTRPDTVPRRDALRYITLGLNLADHGTLSTQPFSVDRVPEPTLLLGGPLVGVELALVARLDASSRQLFECALRNRAAPESCRGSLLGLKLFHYIELVIGLSFLWLIGLRLFRSPVVAAGLVAIATAFRETLEFTNLAQTEPLYLMLYMGFAWGFLRLADRGASPTKALIAGLALGLTILVKPVVAPLLVVVPAMLIVDALIVGRQQSHALRICAAFVGAVLIVIVPWFLRNWSVAGVFGLTDPFYLGTSLAHRLSYNAMNWTEWMTGWIYFLPDFGDNLAAYLFPVDQYIRLGWGEESFYVYGRDVLDAQARRLNSPNPPIGYFIETNVFGEPVKYVAVSLLLLWRGIFVSKYLGLLALAFTPLAVWKMPPEQRRLVAFIGIPAIAIAALNAGLSVSIPRYNLALIPVYAIILTWVLLAALGWFRARRKRLFWTSKSNGS